MEQFLEFRKRWSTTVYQATYFNIVGPISEFISYKLGSQHEYVDNWKSLNNGHSVGVEIETFVQGYQGATPYREDYEEFVDAINENITNKSKVEVDPSGPAIEIVTKPHYNFSELADDITNIYTIMESEVEKKGFSLYDNAIRHINIIPEKRDIINSKLKPMQEEKDEYDGVFKPFVDYYNHICEHTVAEHIHIGAKDVEEGMLVVNELRRHLPDIVALSANSQKGDIADYRLSVGRYGNRLFDKVKTIDDMYRLIRRPKAEDRAMCISRFSTIEVRVPDTQKNVNDALAVAAYVWGIAELAKSDYENNMSYLPEETEEIKHNFDAAIKDGKHAVFETQKGSMKATDIIHNTLLDLEPVFNDLKVDTSIFQKSL